MNNPAILLLIFSLGLSGIYAQTDTIMVNNGEAIQLLADSYTGTIQWQKSGNGMTWMDIAGENLGAYSFTVSGSAGDMRWFRSLVMKDNCIFPSEVQLLIIEESGPVYACSDGLASVTDIDGNVYTVVQIGDQCWMAENLKTNNYNNGDDIPTGLSDFEWENTSSGAYAIYDNDPSNDVIYGKLYNWYAVVDSRGLCPTGWHIPSDTEWSVLTDHLGGVIVAGGKMKSTLSLWNPPNFGATNESGFSCLPGGVKDYYGNYSSIGNNSGYWSSSEESASYAWYRLLFSSDSFVLGSRIGKEIGISVRCLRD